ncbi:MAG: ABC transporter ATP-binding protein [Candidatus Bipolaricaulia bacterium]
MTALFEVRNLHVWLKTFEGELNVLNGVNMAIDAGEKVGLVGETGCGKSLLVKSILEVLPSTARIASGEILFQGKNILTMDAHDRQRLRREGISAIFQDPLAALNPVFTVGHQLGEVIKSSSRSPEGKRLSKKEIRARSIAVLGETGLPDPERILNSYPVQLSGGMRQRICISEALSVGAKLLLADEPTTNLDVTVQYQILRLLDQLVEKKKTSILLISHSLGVVRNFTERVYIMYAGNIVEEAKVENLFSDPLHPYTQGLLESVPKLTGEEMNDGIQGTIPDYRQPPQGCRFHPRCEHAMPICQQDKPPFYTRGDDGDHEVACFLYRREST